MASPRFPKLSPQWWTWLLQPTWLAGAISVGFHGVLFAASPTLSNLNLNALAEPELGNEARRVPLVELTPAEQQRLPDFSNSFYSLSPLDDPLGNLGSIEPIPNNGMLPPIASGGNSDSKPTTTPRRGYVVPYQLPNTVVPGGNTANRPRGTTGSTANSGSGNRATGNTGNSANGNSTSSSGSGTASGGSAPAQQPAPTTGADAPTAADLERQPQNPAPAAGTDSPIVLSAAQQQALTYDGGTSEEEATEAQEIWLAESKDLAEVTALPLEQVNFPLLALINGQQPCLSPEPHQGLVAALVGADGKLTRDPQLLISTGYPFLNHRAIDRVKTLNFSSVQQATAYQFVVQVEYQKEICVDLKANSPAPEPSTPIDKEETPPAEDALE